MRFSVKSTNMKRAGVSPISSENASDTSYSMQSRHNSAENFQVKSTAEIIMEANGRNNLNKVRPTVPRVLKVENSNEDEPKKNIKQKKTKSLFKRSIVFFITHFGMLVLSLVYAGLGAILFRILSQHAALSHCQEIQMKSQEYLHKYLLKIYNYLSYDVTFSPIMSAEEMRLGLIENTTILDGPDEYNQRVEDLLREFRNTVMDNQFGGNYLPDHCESVDHWNFWNAFLFTVTVMSTIGYGHISPKSEEGQLVLICYGMLGIPLFLLSIARFSSVLADLFVFIYRYIVCCPCECYSAYSGDRRTHVEDDENDLEEGNRIDMAQIDSTLEKDVFDTTVENENSKPEDFAPTVVEDDYEDDDDQEEFNEENEQKNIPMLFIFSVTIGFLLLGGLIFNALEPADEWTFVSSLYFSTISFFTIGFGDFAPGVYYIDHPGNTLESLAARNLIVAVLYIFIGISVLGMGISLMQEGATDNIYEFLRKLRVLKAVEEDTEESCEIIEIVNYHNVDEDEDKEEETRDITSNNINEDMDKDKEVDEKTSDDETT